MGSISSWRVVAPRIRTGAFGTSSVERVCARTDGLITSTPQVLPLRFGITTALQINPFLKNCERWVYLAFLKWCAIPKWVPLRWYHFLLVSSVPFVPLFTIYIFFGLGIIRYESQVLWSAQTHLCSPSNTCVNWTFPIWTILIDIRYWCTHQCNGAVSKRSRWSLVSEMSREHLYHYPANH